MHHEADRITREINSSPASERVEDFGDDRLRQGHRAYSSVLLVEHSENRSMARVDLLDYRKRPPGGCSPSERRLRDVVVQR
jgi:hypothetical protein